jgi:Protein of unknown function (DUF4236)
MGFGFRKRKKIAPGMSINFSKRGAGVSVGGKGTRVSGSAGGRKQISVGRKGFFWRKSL